VHSAGRVLGFAADHVGDALWVGVLLAAVVGVVLLAVTGRWWEAGVLAVLLVPATYVTAANLS
jgi:hypothetical protein